MFKRIWGELKSHAPFTLFGALTGIVLMIIIVAVKVKHETMMPMFEGFHTLHVLLSAIVTAAMFRRYGKSIVGAIIVGYLGSVGIATLSDVVFPHHGGALLLHLTGGEGGHHVHFHLPFIEQWWLINPVALLGVTIGIWKPTTKVPHAGHVLLSTWASLFYLVAHAEGAVNWYPLLPLVLVVLFVAVWLPCCVSDIAFPLLFVGKEAAAEHAHEHGEHEGEEAPHEADE